MRATRAYLAGFGTAGSLLAGAAILFVFASAIVSFRGWPQASQHPQPFAIVPAATPASSPQARRVAAVARRQLLAAIPARAAGAARTGAPILVNRQTGTSTHPIARTPGVRVVAPQVGSVAPSPAGSAPTRCTTGSCVVHGVTQTLGGTATSASSQLGSSVTAAGQALGSTVTSVTGGLGSRVGSVSPTVGQTITNTGAAVGATLTSATGTVGSTVSGAGGTLGGLLSSNQ